MSRFPVASLAAVQFLTIAPPIIRRPFTPAELGQAVGYFPLVGLLLGLWLAAVERMLGYLFPPAVVAALLLAVWILCTGGLHFDGFLDTCDGLWGGHTPEARLRILRDERVGAFAVAGGVLLLLLKFTALSNLTEATAALVLAPTIGRWSMSAVLILFPYVRPEGLGRTMKDKAGWRQLFLATVVALLVAVLVAGGQGVLILLGAAAGAWAMARFTLEMIPGLTGDIYGAVCELIEALVLLIFVAGLQP